MSNRKECICLQLGDTEIKLLSYTNDIASNNNFAYFHPHQDEVVSLKAAKDTINKYGGFILSREDSNTPTRNIDFSVQGKRYSIDPNRMFSRVGIEKDLNTSNIDTIDAVLTFAEKVADIVIKQVTRNIIFAVHNNYNKGYSVKSYLPGHSLAKDAEELYINPQHGTGEFFYVTERRIFDILKGGGYSTVLQNKDTVVDDGSFSVYTQQKYNLSYMNVEAQRGRYEQQLEMIEFAVTHIL